MRDEHHVVSPRIAGTKIITVGCIVTNVRSYVLQIENTIIYNNGTNTDLQVQGDNNKYTYSLIQGYYAGQDTYSGCQ